MRSSMRMSRHGGTTFTLLIFVMLLVSTGLMYYYFHRCRVLETELAKWKTGLKEREPTTTVSPPLRAEATKKESLRDFAANLGARLTGTPATEPATKATPLATAVPTVAHKPEPIESEQAPANAALAPESKMPTPAPTPTPEPDREPKPSFTHTTSPATPKPTAAKSRQTPISSLYDLQTPETATNDEPAVRVRAPKRTATPATKLNLNGR